MILDPAIADARARQGTRRGPPPTLAMLRRFGLAPLRKISRSAELALVRDMRELGRLAWVPLGSIHPSPLNQRVRSS